MSMTRAQWLRFALLPLASRIMPAVGAPKHIAQFYYVDDMAARQSLAKNGKSIDVLSPAWLTVDAQGILRPKVDTRIVRMAAAAGNAVMPTLVNDGFRAEIAHLVLTDEKVQRQLTGSLRQLVVQYGFSGIQLDLEEVGADCRETFTAFVRELATVLRGVKAKLTVALPAPLLPAVGPESGTPGWLPNPRAAAFDYKAISRDAAWLTLMAYDEYTWGGMPGPVAGLPWVRACVEHVRQLVPASKLLLGLPLYHRRWAGQKVSEGTFGDASALSAKYAAAATLHKVQLEKVVSFSDGAVSNMVWFNDAESLRLRVALVHEYGLAGYSAWRLGQEDPRVWNSVFSARGGNS